MAIAAGELGVYKAAINGDTGSNGGVMSATKAVDGAFDIWPPVGLSERTAGSIKYRKTFHKNSNAADTALQNALLGLWAPTPGDDRIYLISADQNNSQSSLTGSEPLYGAGRLNAPASASDTVIAVLVEDGATIIFRDKEKIRISNMSDPEAAGGTEEFATISGTPVVAGDVVTFTLSSGLLNAYGSSDTHVASMIEAGEVKATSTTPLVSSASGTVDEAELGLHNIGGIEQAWTATFTGATAYDLVGATVGAVGSGATGASFAPLNGDFGTAYLTLPAAFWAGTWLAGDTVTFTTSPAAVPVFEQRVIPAGADSSIGNKREVLLWGESA
ncbi:MAG: hypothetical protein JKX92_06135 [Porticoccaceae bacterium]|nr:hypothetical protein [Porticoccaceae bacterium]